MEELVSSSRDLLSPPYASVLRKYALSRCLCHIQSDYVRLVFFFFFCLILIYQVCTWHAST